MLPDEVLVVVAKVRLTDAVASAAELGPGQIDQVIWDSELTGFGLRLRPGGKSWIIAYRPVGAGRSANTKRLKLASHGVMPSAADARRLARRVLGQIASGADPLAERREMRRKSKARVSELLDRYEADLERRGYVNRKTVMSVLRRRLSGFAARDIKDVSGAELVEIIDRLEQEGRAGAAADFRSRCSAFLAWSVTRARVIDTNPLAGFRKARVTRADRVAKLEHGRALDDEELAALWAAATPDTSFGRAIRFLILTGCRRHEAAGLRRAMVDRQSRLIRLPAIFVKQGRDHLIPYPEFVEEVFRLCPIDGRSDLVFPSHRTGREISGWSKLVPALRVKSGVDFQLHDLRRTCRTGLSKVGVETEIAELALGHARNELEAIYNRDDATARLRSAFERWADHVATIAGRDTGMGLFG